MDSLNLPTATHPAPKAAVPEQREPVVISPAGIPQHCAGPQIAPSPAERDSYSVTAISDIIDRSIHAAAARFSLGLSPAAMAAAYLDWATHLAFSPGKQIRLVDKAIRKALRLADYARRSVLQAEKIDCCIEPLPHDRRFAGEEWRGWPFNVVHQAFLLQQQWWHNATTDVRGVTRQHEDVVTFMARQLLDTASPSNFFLTNPKALRTTLETGGVNLIEGWRNFLEDWERAVSGKRPVGADEFQPGKQVAITPGKVIYQNRLMELIQYAPATASVRPQPILVVPAWIMKYYILDLSPHNSMVRYLVDKGFTVFMISWKNPGPEDRDVGLEAYLDDGIMAALDAVNAVCPGQKTHAVGYCLGGTLLAIAAAALSRDGDARLQTMTLLASQTDFTEAGELTLFINESQLSFLEDMMWEQGFLDARQMAGAFQMLRSNDLIWSRVTHDYLMGERTPMTDLMAWSADATRMPYRMHSQYLRSLFFNNDLAEGRFLTGGRPVALSDIRLPIFAVGTVQDHIAPWRSTYKINLLTNTAVTFILTNGGHNGGIVADPAQTDRTYRIMHKGHDQPYVGPDVYETRAPRKVGSWWGEWAAWLELHSAESVQPPAMGGAGIDPATLPPAPGRYVLQD